MNNKKGKTKSQAAKLAVTLLTIIVKVSANINSKYEVSPIKIDLKANIKCESEQTKYFYKVVLRADQNKPISLNAATDGKYVIFRTEGRSSVRSNVFDVTSGVKCLEVPPKKGVSLPLIAVLVIKKVGTGSSCQVAEVILNRKALQPCGTAGLDNVDLFKLFQFEGGESAFTSFSSIQPSAGVTFNQISPILVKTENIDRMTKYEPFYQMMLYEPLTETNSKKSLLQLDYDMIQKIDKLKVYDTPLSPSSFMKRLTHQNLPGYLLGKTAADSPDEKEEELAFLTNYRFVDGIKSMFMSLYISNFKALGRNKAYNIDITTFRLLNGDQNPQKYQDFKLEFVRSDDFFLTIRIKFRDKTAMGSFQIFSEDDFFYLTFFIGKSFHTFGENNQVIPSYYIGTNTYQGQRGSRMISMMEFKDESIPLNQFQSTGEAGFSEDRLIKIKLTDPEGGSLNTPGFRILDLGYARGVYPATHEMKPQLDPKYEKCYFRGYEQNRCFGSALMANEADTIGLSYTINQEGYLVDVDSGSKGMVEGCMVPVWKGACLIPKVGYMVDLRMGAAKTPIGGSLVSQVDFEKLSKDLQAFYAVVKDEKGVGFLALCPESCKWILL